MFRYVPTDRSQSSFYSSYPTKDAAYIEDLLALIKAGEVERVIIPQTFDFAGYGADLMSMSNSRSIQRDYGRRVKPYGHELSISAWQFKTHEEFRAMIQRLEEDYPLYDEQDYSNLESETLEDFVVDELFYALDSEEATEEDTEGAPLGTRDQIREVLHSGHWDARIEWWEYCAIDNDGLTPYMTKEQLAELLVLLKARAAAILAEREKAAFTAAGNTELPGL